MKGLSQKEIQAMPSLAGVMARLFLIILTCLWIVGFILFIPIALIIWIATGTDALEWYAALLTNEIWEGD